MLTTWMQSLITTALKRIRANVVSQFTFANGAIEEVSETPATLYGTAAIVGNKLVQTNTGNDHMSWPGVVFEADEDFTIECMMNYTGVGSSTRGGLFGVWNVSGNNNNAWLMYIQTATLYFVYSLNGTAVVTITSNTVPKSQDVHIAITREAGTIRMFIDGVLVKTTTGVTGAMKNSTRPCDTTWPGGGNTALKGSIWNIRIAKGEAFYTENFTPPTTI